MNKYISNSVEETMSIAEKFAENLRAGDTVLYTGEMGAGKTHFTKGIARHFGVTEEITSPTFALVNEYRGNPEIFHFDLFRISSYDDLYAIGFFDYLDREGILAVEWSENIPQLAEYLENTYIVDIVKTGDSSREITISERKD